MNQAMTTTKNGHGTMREGFGERSMALSAETQTAALQAQAQAAVQARFVMSMQRPRSWEDVRVRILSECKRPGFAEVARYRKPIGKGIEGPSIRFAEACARYAGNLGVETATTFDDEIKRIIHVTAVDYETNASFSSDITIQKVVERKDPKGRKIVAQRTNSYGDPVYLVEATEDEMLNAVNALVSKATRTLILRLIPADIVEEAQEECVKTTRDKAAKDPAGERKRLCDAFAQLGVMPADLVRYVGHSLDAMQPAELVELRQVYGTIRDGETTWREILAAREGNEQAETSAKKPTLVDKLKAKKEAKKAPQEPPPPPAEAQQPATVEPPQPTVEHDTETGEVVPPENAGDAWEAP
ncbi:MAG: hypothetical protein FWD73_07125 [Polyangiaceae bacterium]|nr:hypothetical protein [Polyangiaceae bacterium]